MLRNREARHLALAAIGISIALTAAAAVYSAVAALFVLATAALLIACFLFYTRRRYHEIAELSGYLRRIASGDLHRRPPGQFCFQSVRRVAHRDSQRAAQDGQEQHDGDDPDHCPHATCIIEDAPRPLALHRPCPIRTAAPAGAAACPRDHAAAPWTGASSARLECAA